MSRKNEKHQVAKEAEQELSDEQVRAAAGGMYEAPAQSRWGEVCHWPKDSRVESPLVVPPMW